jgi:hypothetical protein
MLIHHLDQTIKVIPRFGLGNRLMAIGSALRLQKLGYFRTVRVQWEASGDLNANFSDLLEIDNIVQSSKDPDDIYVGFPNKHRIPNHDRVTVEACDIFTVEDDPTDPNIINKEIAAVFNQIRFKPYLYALADKYDVAGRTGLHCRRSDYPFSRPPINTGIIPKYHEVLDHGFAANIKTTYPGPYFLASDSAKTDAYFIEQFPGIITVPKKHYPEWSVRPLETVIEGVVDMILLSRCRILVGDSPSTFSTVAAWLGGIEKMIWQRPWITL